MWRCLVPVAMKSAKRSGLTRRRTGSAVRGSKLNPAYQNPDRRGRAGVTLFRMAVPHVLSSTSGLQASAQGCALASVDEWETLDS